MKMEQRYTIRKILISKGNLEKIENHCIRKLKGIYKDNETKEKQAFGILIGEQIKNTLKITKVIPLRVNYRYDSHVSERMNRLIKKYAIPGGLNIEERAWAINPVEIAEILKGISNNEIFIGTYHMHHDKSWKGEYPKELPTKLDEVLAEKSGLYNFIIYINSDKSKNKVRAFYESKVENEIHVVKC